MRKIPLNVSSSDFDLPPRQAALLTSPQVRFQSYVSWVLIYPIRFIALISNSFAG
jgi:hypothetical protein